MINIPYKQLEQQNTSLHPALQLLIFIAVFIGILFLGNIMGAGIIFALYGTKTLMGFMSMNITVPHFVNALWILQTAGTTLPIFIAPVVFAYAIVREPGDYIKPNFHFSWLLIPLILLTMVFSNPIIEVLSNINQKMQLPYFLRSVQQWMKDSEDTAQKVTGVILQMKNIWDMIFDVLFIGLLTAIVEEFMFRGVLQTIFFRWTKNIHVAIWITAILFSAFHMEFFGFLPRLMLGVLFGYFVAWSGSIWTSVWAHFINNGTAVVITYLYQQKSIKVNPDDTHVFNVQLYLLSLATMLFLLFLYHKITVGRKQITEYN